MAWTNPAAHIWATGEVLSAPNFNTYIEADLVFLYGDTSWTVPGFLNAWLDFGSPFPRAGFRLAGTRVFCRGCIKNGTIGQPAFTLPVGYRPLGEQDFSVMSASAFGKLQVFSDGTFQPTIGSNSTFFLDQVTFDTI